MPHAAQKNDVGELREALSRLNAAWRESRWADLEDCLHEGVVIVFPGFVGRAEGKAACVDGYKDFVRRADIRAFAESDHTFDIWGDTAVASYRFDIEYRMKERPYEATGHDLLVFKKKGGRWLAVWRSLVPGSPAE